MIRCQARLGRVPWAVVIKSGLMGYGTGSGSELVWPRWETVPITRRPPAIPYRER